MTKDIETRGGLLGVEVRSESEKRTLVGYAAVFNSDADIGGYWVERIAPGAFTETIKGDIRALVGHDSSKIIGRTKSGTLRLSEDAKGLFVEIDVPDTTVGNDLWVLVDRGDISGMSFGFRATKDTWDETVDPPVRTIQALELFEVSAVVFPAYDDTTIGKRSLDAARAEAEAAKSDSERRSDNKTAAARRIAERRATSEQKFRGIRQDAS